MHHFMFKFYMWIHSEARSTHTHTTKIHYDPTFQSDSFKIEFLPLHNLPEASTAPYEILLNL
jgi:hypothetical protein